MCNLYLGKHKKNYKFIKKKQKIIKQIMIKITAILFLATLSSCGIDMLNRIEGNNNVISINRDINEDFTKVRAVSYTHLTLPTKA